MYFSENIELVGLVAGCVVVRDGKFLLVQEKVGKAAGLWNLPAGYVDKGESLKEAACREVREETGLDVTVGQLIGVWHTEATESVKHAFYSKVVGGNLDPRADEIRAVEWFTFDQIVALNGEKKLRAPWVFQALSLANDAGGV